MNASAVDTSAAWMAYMYRSAYLIETGDRQTLLRLAGVNINMPFAFTVQREPPTHQGHGWLDSFPSDGLVGILPVKLISLHAETT